MVLDENRIPRETLKVLFVGNVELPYNLANYVKDLGLSDVVSLYPQISYQESLGYLQKASAALLLQPGTKTQVPSKLFDYIGAAKPVLAISPEGGATYNLVKSEKLGELAVPESPNQIANGLERLYSQWVLSRESLSISPAVQHKFDIRHLTKSLACELQALSLR
jgi:glycosyltransferase involved in cell wall biosynthesis